MVCTHDNGKKGTGVDRVSCLKRLETSILFFFRKMISGMKDR
ncbi:hypothetical protein D1BOALGB6SA_5901 [Olavius sp. associated proteobacterium Delta 1]|nr:hypothetical protein D1BOALGB6SA_5901 [Olavius sp. associated proteobacterium Delta 1]